MARRNSPRKQSPARRVEADVWIGIGIAAASALLYAAAAVARVVLADRAGVEALEGMSHIFGGAFSLAIGALIGRVRARR